MMESSSSTQTNFIERLLFGEGVCDGCGELKVLAMVALQEGAAAGYIKTRADGSRYVLPAPRHGYCLPCAREAAAAGKFSKARGKRQKKQAPEKR
jgi:hypothetical protein